MKKLVTGKSKQNAGTDLILRSDETDNLLPDNSLHTYPKYKSCERTVICEPYEGVKKLKELRYRFIRTYSIFKLDMLLAPIIKDKYPDLYEKIMNIAPNNPDYLTELLKIKFNADSSYTIQVTGEPNNETAVIGITLIMAQTYEDLKVVVEVVIETMYFDKGERKYYPIERSDEDIEMYFKGVDEYLNSMVRGVSVFERALISQNVLKAVSL